MYFALFASWRFVVLNKAKLFFIFEASALQAINKITKLFHNFYLACSLPNNRVISY